MSNNNSSSSSSGIGVLGVTQIVFIILKLVNVVDWTWVQVFIPTFISVGITVLALVVVGIEYFFSNRY